MILGLNTVNFFCWKSFKTELACQLITISLFMQMDCSNPIYCCHLWDDFMKSISSLFRPVKMSAVIERWHFLIFQFFKTWWEMKSPRNSEFPQVIDMAISYLQLIFPPKTLPQHPLYIKSISIGIIKMTSNFIYHKSFFRGGY